MDADCEDILLDYCSHKTKGPIDLVDSAVICRPIYTYRPIRRIRNASLFCWKWDIEEITTQASLCDYFHTNNGA